MLYTNGKEYAIEHNELDKWRSSLRTLRDTSEKMRSIISEEYSDNILDTDTILTRFESEFDGDVIRFVLANAVQLHEDDGRISSKVRNWAKSVEINDDDASRYLYSLGNTHPTLLDAVVSEWIKKYENKSKRLNKSVMKESRDPKLGKKVKQLKGWKIYKGTDNDGNELYRMFTPDEDYPEIGYEDWEAGTIEEAISWIENYEEYDDEPDEDSYDELEESCNSKRFTESKIDSRTLKSIQTVLNTAYSHFDEYVREYEKSVSLFSSACKKVSYTLYDLEDNDPTLDDAEVKESINSLEKIISSMEDYSKYLEKCVERADHAISLYHESKQ